MAVAFINRKAPFRKPVNHVNSVYLPTYSGARRAWPHNYTK